MSAKKKRVPVTCACGSVRWLTVQDAKRVTKCKRCHNQSIARKGYDKVVELYGNKAGVKHVRQHLLDNPSSLEKILTQTLTDLGVSYEREFWLQEYDNSRVFLIDFAVRINGKLRFIEVNGNYVHSYHTERDALKVDTIARLGYPLLVLGDEDVQAPDLTAVVSFFLAKAA